jgi:hypothetical protein
MGSRWLGLLLMGLMVGCGKVRTIRQYPAEVKGVVTLEGNPLPLGTVTFYPTDSKEKDHRHPLIGAIGPTGEYHLGSHPADRTRGAMPGKYRVSILAMEPRPGEHPIARSLVPDRYQDARQSPVLVTVHPGDNRIDLPLQR